MTVAPCAACGPIIHPKSHFSGPEVLTRCPVLVQGAMPHFPQESQRGEKPPRSWIVSQLERGRGYAWREAEAPRQENLLVSCAGPRGHQAPLSVRAVAVAESECLRWLLTLEPEDPEETTKVGFDRLLSKSCIRPHGSQPTLETTTGKIGPPSVPTPSPEPV